MAAFFLIRQKPGKGGPLRRGSLSRNCVRLGARATLGDGVLGVRRGRWQPMQRRIAEFMQARSRRRNCLRQGGRGRARRRCSDLLRGGRAPRQHSIRQFMQARGRVLLATKCLAPQKLMPCAVKGHCEGVHSVRRARLCSLAVQGAIYASETMPEITSTATPGTTAHAPLTGSWV